jgi:glycosyltransferase XagB
VAGVAHSFKATVGGTLAQRSQQLAQPADRASSRVANAIACEPLAAFLDRLNFAVEQLSKIDPVHSAKTGLWPRQRQVLGALAVALLVVGVSTHAVAATMFHAIATLVFAMLFAVRLIAIYDTIRQQSGAKRQAPRTPDSGLPVYTVIVALHREVPVVPQLVAALQALDYPPSKLDIIFALESDDCETLAALLAETLPEHMRLIVVPDGIPRTKPRALCYAMTFARGSYVAVYDAEDIPAPDQLRCALAAFDEAGPKMGCVQARLAISNARQSWLTTQFAIEYTALFDALLPALARYGLPLPLGGTSNHFPKHVLDSVGGWDPYNVTEDADLGFRLARFGWRTGVIESATWEEAPHTWKPWLAQRTRWQKGWLQTYFVHMRAPRRLLRDLGPVAWIWFQIVLGGGLVSALIHPLFYVSLAWQIIDGTAFPALSTGLAAFLWWLGVANLVAAYVATVLLALLTLARRGRRDLFMFALVSPLYWLPISLAAYRAVWDWYRRPFFWAKTPHGGGVKD